MYVQVRSEETGIRHYYTLADAFQAAKADETIWKISFTVESGERIRLVKHINRWVYEPIFPDMSVNWTEEDRKKFIEKYTNDQRETKTDS